MALVVTTITVVVSLTLLVLDPRDWRELPELREEAERVIGVAVGVAVALRAGGWRAVVGLVAAVIATDLINVVIAAPTLALFCERSGTAPPLELCGPRTPFDAVVARWPVIAGFGVGLLLARHLRERRGGSNASFEAIGAMAAGQTFARLFSVPFMPAPDDAETMRIWMILSALNFAMALIAGHVLVRRGARPWPAAVSLAALYAIAPFLPSLGYYMKFPLVIPLGGFAWLTIAPVANALALILASVVTAAFGRPRPPDAGAVHRAAR